MTLTFKTEHAPDTDIEVQCHLNEYAVRFRFTTGRVATAVDLLRELRRTGYEAWLTDGEDDGTNHE